MRGGHRKIVTGHLTIKAIAESWKAQGTTRWGGKGRRTSHGAPVREVRGKFLWGFAGRALVTHLRVDSLISCYVTGNILLLLKLSLSVEKYKGLDCCKL